MPRVHRISRAFLCVIALTLFVVPTFEQGTAIEPCQPTPTPTKPGITSAPAKVATRSSLRVVDASIANDPDIEKLLAPYSARVLELSKVIGTLEGQLDRTAVGAGSLVVCMSHLGYYENGKRGDSFVASQIDGIDLIASGHTHTFMEQPVTQAQPCGAKTLIFQVGKSGIYVGRVDFTFRTGKVIAASGRLLDLRNV